MLKNWLPDENLSQVPQTIRTDMPTLLVSNFNVVCATLGGFITLFGLVSYLFKEKFYLSEAREYTVHDREEANGRQSSLCWQASHSPPMQPILSNHSSTLEVSKKTLTSSRYTSHAWSLEYSWS